MEEKKKMNFLEGYTKLEKKNFRFVFFLLLFPILQFLIFYVYINISSFKYAFTDISGNFSLYYIKNILQEFVAVGPNNLANGLLRSFITWCCSNFIVFPISIIFSYALFKKIKGEMFFRVLFFIPGIIGIVVLGILYNYLVGATGPVVSLLDTLGLSGENTSWYGLLSGDSAFGSILFFGIWINLGSNIIVITGSMTRIPEDIFESAQLDGCEMLQEFIHIVLPLIWGTISTLLIFALAAILTADNGTYLLMGDTIGNAPVSTMGYYLFMLTLNVSEGAEVANKPAALGLILTIVTVPLVLIIRRIIEKHSDLAEF